MFRYTIAELTDAGHRVVVNAAPIHVNAVRELVLDRLTASDRQALTRIAAKLHVVKRNTATGSSLEPEA